MKTLIGLLLAGGLALSAGATSTNLEVSDTDQLRQLLLSNPDNPYFDFNGDEKVDVADLVVALNADNSIYLRPDVRHDAMQEGADFFSSLASMELTAKNASLVDWLEAHPLFDEVGISSGEVVWATFTDGLPILFIDNRDDAPTTNPPPPSPPSPITDPTGWETAVVPAGEPTTDLILNPRYLDSELPYGKRVEVINGFGNGWAAQQSAVDLVGMFDRAGYEIGPVTRIGDVSRTVADLMNLHGVDVFYMSGHGGEGRFDDAPFNPGVTGAYYTVTTFDSVRLAEMVAYAPLYLAKEVVPVVCSSSRDEDGNPITNIYWGLTENFIEHYVTMGDPNHFQQSSIAIIDSCSSTNVRYREAFYNSGAAMYVGWTVPVGDSSAALAMDHYFSRLLGEDSVVANATTNVRPFDFHTVFQEMKRLNLVNIGGSTLRQYGVTTNSDLGMLRPMLHTVHVYQASDKIFLFGIFGNNPDEITSGPRYPVVTVDGHELNITEWRRWVIECDIPSSGSGSIGDVVVTINGLESNPVPLTEFSGMATATQFFQEAGGEMTEIASADFTYRVRQCVHPFRLLPDMDPVWPWVSTANFDYDHPEFLKIGFRHLESGYEGYGSFERGDQMIYTYGGAIAQEFCGGTFSGGGTLDSHPFDPYGTEIDETGYWGFMKFFNEDGSDDVRWILEVDPEGAVGTYTPEVDCGDPGDTYAFTHYDNQGAGVVVDTSTFVIPAGSHTNNPFLAGDQKLEWSELTPCCNPLTGYPN